METSDSEDFADGVRLERDPPWFPSLGGSLSRPGVLFLKAADNVPAAINTYARVNTSRLSPRVKQLEGLPVSLFFHVSSRSRVASSSTYTHIRSSSLLFPVPSSSSSSFFASSLLPFREETESDGVAGGPRESTGQRRNIAGRHFSRRNAESLRSREALRSKRPRCSYRFRRARGLFLSSLARRLVFRALYPLQE